MFRVVLWQGGGVFLTTKSHREISVFPGKSLSPIVNVVVGGEAVLVPEAPNAS